MQKLQPKQCVLCGNKVEIRSRQFDKTPTCRMLQSLGNPNRYYIDCLKFGIGYEILFTKQIK